ncbi:aldo/keto reductase [Bradyrhizobium elkanii]|uniref:aldo/keto reductase n=1 Tax=Bradyrhizobium elkanii TaxID=29448 RepID=UPI001BAE17D1|nr:aldo/keto reductase [Bradyrhizobium elkanii]MBR1165073.1 aldo/keto reductase [Bradyrhizobium elkanii]
MNASTISLGGDLTVNRIGFGAMRVTTDGPDTWGYPTDRTAAIAFLRRMVDCGVNFIDTADSYGPHTSEMLIAEALHPYPMGLVIGTKGGVLHNTREVWDRNGRPQHLRAACEASLKRLRLERIDLYQLHSVDPDVPIAESVGALADLQREGKIRHIGVGNVTLSELARAKRAARIVSVQNHYNIAEREHDIVLDACTREGIAFIACRPLGKGTLPDRSGLLVSLAEKRGATASQLALAWLLHRSPMTLPIPGTTSATHFDENGCAAHIMLSDAEFETLSR